MGKVCDTCENERPTDKFTADSFSPNTCFRCRIQGVKFGFVAGRENFHGDTLVGGTIKSDNKNTVEMAKAQGHDPVPVHTAGGVGVSQKELNRLKSIV